MLKLLERLLLSTMIMKTTMIQSPEKAMRQRGRREFYMVFTYRAFNLEKEPLWKEHDSHPS